ncbi:hypothetical protein HY745_06615 [Candidatus Desantisbacteria bacterium]|nr:hypothetical protein [Candidatus Desantisbacteria bacterium]
MRFKKEKTIELAEENSNRKNVFSRLKRHKLAWTGGIILLILYTAAIFADFISPYSYDTENRLRQYEPPVALYFKDETGKFSLRPYIHNYRLIIEI